MTRTLEILPNELTDGTGTVARRSGSQELFTPLIVIPELSNEPDLQIKLECNSIWIINMDSLVSGMWCHEEELINYFIFWFDAWNKALIDGNLILFILTSFFFNENRKEDSIFN